MKTLSKALVGTIAAGAVALSSAAPAMADSYGHRDRGGISAGDVIGGALVIGGIAAVASAASSHDRGYDRRYSGDYSYDRAGYGNWNSGYYGNNDRNAYWRGNPRQAVEQCVNSVEQSAGRYSYGRADVTDIRDVRDTRYGFEVRGRVAVNRMGRDWRSGDGYYGRGWGGDYRGWNNNLRGYDSGSFKCKVERGRVVNLDFSGIRGL
ncbi:MAG: hypothetical protein KGM49_04080 [Sphingomonadales bacterium]|nr:hypothetical protein [Sphingomonadales bacterium]